MMYGKTTISEHCRHAIRGWNTVSKDELGVSIRKYPPLNNRTRLCLLYYCQANRNEVQYKIDI